MKTIPKDFVNDISGPFWATLVNVSGLVLYFSIAAVILGGTLL
jgi:magnesium transporter